MVRSLVASIELRDSSMRSNTDLVAFASVGEKLLEMPLSERKQFREVKRRIGSAAVDVRSDRKLVGLLAEAVAVRELVLAITGARP